MLSLCKYYSVQDTVWQLDKYKKTGNFIFKAIFLMYIKGLCSNGLVILNSQLLNLFHLSRVDFLLTCVFVFS